MADNAIPTGSSAEELVYSALKTAGFSDAAAAGIMGNIQIESGFNSAAENPSEGAIGLAQWEGGRRTALQQFAAAQGTSETDVKTQIIFLINESKERGNYDAVNQFDRADDAAAYWDANFEVSAGSARNERMLAANAFFGKIQDGTIKNIFMGPGGSSLWDSIKGAITGGAGVVGGAAGSVGDAARATKDWATGLAKLLKNITSPDFWKRAGKGLIGALLIIYAALKITGTEEIAKATAKSAVTAAAA
ncbi:MAG: phage tail tip lysozyme [Anaerolineae bacterium]